jgi:hypothetical protein
VHHLGRLACELEHNNVHGFNLKLKAKPESQSIRNCTSWFVCVKKKEKKEKKKKRNCSSFEMT